jgi:predicted transcriptional regulator
MVNTKQHEVYRSRDQIIFQILQAIKEYEPRGGILRTRLTMLANITNIQLKGYLRQLLDNELITCDSSKGYPVAASVTDYRKAKGSRRGDTYHITSKGLKYLLMIDEMQKGLPGLHI